MGGWRKRQRPTDDGSSDGTENGVLHPMHTTIDSAGRVVVPKRLREALGLRAGTRLGVSERNGAIILEPESVPMLLVGKGRRVAVEPAKPLPALTAAEVRAILESGRR